MFGLKFKNKKTNQHHRYVVHAPDRISIVGFNEEGFQIALPAEPHAHWLQERSQRLHKHVKGRTNIADGLRVGIEMCKKTPRGILRRIWLLSDGEANVNPGGIWPMVQRAYKSHININTIGFGNSFDESTLRKISASTHRGKFVPVKSLRELTNTLTHFSSNGNSNGFHHRSETTVLVIDLSASMGWAMGNKTKVQVVEEAILHLLLMKQKMFS